MILDKSRTVSELTDDGEKKQTWIGTIRGVPTSRAVFTSVAGLTAATIRFPDTGLLILPDGRVWKQDARFSCGNPANHSSLRDDSSRLTDDPELGPATDKATATPWEIRLALPFSKGAPAVVGGVAALRTLLLNQQDVLNEDMRASGLGDILRITVVGVRQSAYDENDPKRSGVNYVTFKKFGTFMKQNRADLLLMLVARHPNGFAGSSNQYDGDPKHSLGIVDLHTVTNVLLHELGHLLSALHEQAYVGCPSGGQAPGNDFVTVMWAGRAPDACAPEFLHQFSNLYVIHPDSGLPTGDRTHCNACRIRKVVEKVSKFRN